MPTTSIGANSHCAMSALAEIFTQYPALGWILFAAVAFGALWKVFNVLYVKPRDFRIDSLEQELKGLKATPKERESGGVPTPTAPVRQLETHDRAKLAEPNTPAIVSPTASPPEQQANEGDPLAEGLRSLAIALARLNDKDSTRLQLESVVQYFIGKHVVWSATVLSVSDVKYGSISVTLRDGDDQLSGAHAKFDETQRADLLKLRRGDRVVVSGQITQIRIGTPFLEQCSITKTPE